MRLLRESQCRMSHLHCADSHQSHPAWPGSFADSPAAQVVIARPLVRAQPGAAYRRHRPVTDDDGR